MIYHIKDFIGEEGKFLIFNNYNLITCKAFGLSSTKGDVNGCPNVIVNRLINNGGFGGEVDKRACRKKNPLVV